MRQLLTFAHGEHKLRALVRPESIPPAAKRASPAPKRARSEDHAPAGRCASALSILAWLIVW